MPSKKRGGLSKREVAAKASGGSLNYKTGKITVAPKAQPKIAPLLGAGPLQPGQTRVANSYGGGSQLSGAGPLSPGQTRVPDSYIGGTSQRDQAAKARQRQSTPKSSPSLQSTGNSLLGIPTARAASNEPIDYNQASLKPTGQVPKGAAGSIFNKGADWLRQSAPMGVSSLLQALNQTGIDLSSLSGVDELFGLKKDSGIAEYRTADNQYIADQQGMADFGQLRQQDPTADANDYMQRRANQQEQRNSGNLAPWADSSVPTARASTGDTGGNANGNNGNNNQNQGNNNQNQGNNFDPSFMGNGEGDANNPYYQDPIKVQNDYNQQQNEQNDGGPGPIDQPAPRVTNQVRGSGLFGTGKGVGNPAGKDDSYIKELRKAYANNGGEKWLRQQFEELIKALDPTYAALQTEGTNALNENLRNQNNQLASVMNAGNVGDSEQRAQMMAQQNQGTQTAIGALLAKLAQGKASDVSGYRTQEATQMGQLRDRNQTNQQRLMEQIQQYRNQQQSLSKGQGRVALGAPAKQKALSHNDIFNWTNEAINQGGSWAEIANQAKANGIDTSTGSYLDQLLNNANKQNRYAA